MTHELRYLPNASHELLTHVLVGAGITALAIALLVGYLLWRDRRSNLGRKPDRPASVRRIRSKPKRSRR